VPFSLPGVVVGQFRISMRDIACQCLFLPWLAPDLTTISPRHLNVVMVARLVQILGAQVTAACATRRAPYHRPPLPGGPSHPVT
jgi:hypothetical protein